MLLFQRQTDWKVWNLSVIAQKQIINDGLVIDFVEKCQVLTCFERSNRSYQVCSSLAGHDIYIRLAVWSSSSSYKLISINCWPGIRCSNEFRLYVVFLLIGIWSWLPFHFPPVALRIVPRDKWVVVAIAPAPISLLHCCWSLDAQDALQISSMND